MLASWLLPAAAVLAVVASTKSTQDLFNSFGLWFSHTTALLSNIKETFTQDDGVFARWLLNTVLYAVVSALGAALLAAAAGYGFAKYRFRGHGAAFNLVLGAIMVPTTALAIPTYLLFARSAWSTRRGRHPALAGQPVRPLPHAGLRRRTPSPTASSRPPASTAPASSGSSSGIALRCSRPAW
jgi:ABC-type glycerol-3-phosphate transport system permease component